MPRTTRLLALSTAATLVLALSACSSDSTPAGSSAGPGTTAGGDDWTPVTVESALGTATITEKPERVATVNWENQEVPLALGVVPVGMAAANFGDDDGDGILPWVENALDELGGEAPVLFDETDGIDFEAVADTQPDVILAAYSGLTQEDFDTLSDIAPVVAYPETAWGTSWRDMITTNAKGMGMEAEGEQLVADIESEIESTTAKHSQLAGTSAMFLTHVDEADLSQVSFYTPSDTRAQFFEDLGMTTPKSIATASADTDEFALTVSAEQADAFDDVDVIVTYGGDDLVDTLESDPLLSQIPAVKNGAIVALPGTSPLGTAANPTPLAISWVLDDYTQMLADAADASDA